MFKFLQRTVDENGKNVGYLLMDLESETEVTFTNKDLKYKLTNNEIQVDGLIISESGRVIEYDEEKERIKSEKKQELDALLSMEVKGDAWLKEEPDTFIIKAKSGLFDILSALDGSYTVYRCDEFENNFVVLDKNESLVALGQDDKSLNIRPIVEETQEVLIEEESFVSENVIEEEFSDEASKVELLEDISDKSVMKSIDRYYGLSLPVTADKKVLLTTSKSLFADSLDETTWEFVDGLKDECKKKRLSTGDFTYTYEYDGNDVNVIYRTLPTFVHISDRELIDVDLPNFKLYRVAWTKGLREKMIKECLNGCCVTFHVNALLEKSYVLVENEEDFYSFVDSLSLPRDWFILRETKMYKENESSFKHIGVGVFFTDGLYQIDRDKCYIETILY